MRDGLTAEQYRWKKIRKWRKAAQTGPDEPRPAPPLAVMVGPQIINQRRLPAFPSTNGQPWRTPGWLPKKSPGQRDDRGSFNMRVALLRLASLGSGIPHASGLLAGGLSLGGCYVSCKGGRSKSNCKTQSDNR
jgi:hypothetical protein